MKSIHALSIFCLIILFILAPVPVLANELIDLHPGQAELHIRTFPDQVSFRVPKILIERELAGSSGSNYQIKSFSFQPSNHPEQFQIRTQSIFTVGGNNFDCNIGFTFEIPAAPLTDARFLELDHETACDNNGLLGPVFEGEVASLLGSIIEGRLRAQLPVGDSLPSDPSTREMFAAAKIQGISCDSTMGPAICLNISWPFNKLNVTMNSIVEAAPKSLGKADTTGLQQLHDSLVSHSRESDPIQYNGAPYSYPVRTDDSGHPDDYDMAFFGGLLCLSGDQQGCTLVERSQGTSGQIWRSPNRIDKPDPENEFSGDALTGAIAFFSKSKLKDQLKLYLQYISGNKVNVPDDTGHLDTGYKTCALDPGNNCLLIGQDWFLLNALAKALNLGPYIPVDAQNVAARFGFSSAFLPWEAMLYKEGYRLHLIGAEIFILRALGIQDANFDRAASIMASRQPHNAFFAFLHLGKDQYVANLIKKECITPGPAFTDWAWKNPDTQNDDWQHYDPARGYFQNMGWDCVFMLNNLLH